MGQTHSEKISDALHTLREKDKISESQARAFNEEMEERRRVVEVERFIESPRMENFLIQLIKHQYPAEHMSFDGFPRT